ncbi:hypothetical protein JCM10449v2_001222 [Rhodotorula kratochvilovae]
MSSSTSTGPPAREPLGSGGQVGVTALGASSAASGGVQGAASVRAVGAGGGGTRAGTESRAVDHGGRVETAGGPAQVRAASSSSAAACTAAPSEFSPAAVGAISPVALNAALAALATNHLPQQGVSTSSAAAARHQPLVPLPVATTSSASAPVAAAPSGLGAPPARPVDRTSRLSSLKSRLSPSSRTISPAPTTSDHATSQRPLFKRRFSRSLTSFQAALLSSGETSRNSPSADDASEGGKLAKWRAKGKAKLVSAFKSPALESPPSSPPGSSSAFIAGVGRMPSRSRAHSAPLFLPRAPSGAAGELNTLLVPVATPAELLAPGIVDSPVDAASPIPSAPVFAPEQEPCDSPAQSDFATCPTSPFASAFASLPNASQILSPCSPLPAPPQPVNHFDWLPHELQLRVFAAVIEVCEEDWREEVCKTWRTLSLDGQLWTTAPATSLLGADTYTRDGLTALLAGARSFVTTLDARGLGKALEKETLGPLVLGGSTMLQKIDLTGCTSLTSSTLSRLIAISPHLVELVVPGLPCVSTHHLGTLAMHCPRLARLDVSRCPNLTAYWLLSLPYPPPRSSSAPSVPPSLQPGLKSLKASTLRAMDHVVFATLLQRHPGLETLDVSSCVQVRSEALRQAIAIPLLPASSARPSQVGVNGSTLLSPSPPPAKQVYPALRHLNLSGCKLLTSGGLHHLAGSLPNLEILELSRIGATLRADGLAQLLASCPALRKVDLEDASEATDEVLLALVPSPRDGTGAPNLTHLLIAGCKTFTDGAIAAVALEHGCSKLRVLEADGTAISSRTAKAFVRLAGARALAAQAVARARRGKDDPLIARRYPAVLSVLDNRETGRSLSRDVGWADLRPRNGQRGHWTHAVELYHDDDGAGAAGPEREKVRGVLNECDPARVVVRSFYSNLAVDAARAARDAREAKERAPLGAKSALMRSRAMSDSDILRHARGQDEEDGRVGCVIA